MARSPRLLALNLTAALVGLVAFFVVVARPVYGLLQLRLRPHGSFEDDFEFYYGLTAITLRALGQYGGLTLCILGITLALSSGLGLRVGYVGRVRARTWFAVVPIFCFFAEMLGRYLIQTWYGRQGLLFPSTLFIRDTLPDFCWLALAWLLTAPAIQTGLGWYLFPFHRFPQLLSSQRHSRRA